MRFLSVLALGFIATGLSACGSSAVFGQKAAPDETYVVDGPSLTLPPQFTLRPPANGTMAEDTLKGQAPANPDDAWLMQQAGQADPTIREQLRVPTPTEAEADVQDKEKSSWWPF